MGLEPGDGHFQGMAVDQADQPQLFRRRDELACRRNGTVLAPHAQQAFIFDDLTRMSVDDRLIGEDQALALERGHHFVGHRHEAQAGAFALRRTLIHIETVAAAAAGALQGFFGAQHGFLAGGGARRQPHRTDRRGRGDLARPRIDHAAADGGAQTVGHGGDFAAAAILQDDSEFVAGRTADDVGGAQRARQPFADRHDHFVGGVETIRIVDDRQPVDGGNQKGTMAFFAFRGIDRFGEFGAQRIAVQVAGQFVARRQIGEALLFAPALGDLAHHADHPLGGAVGIGNARAQYDEPNRPQSRSQFDIDIEMTGFALAAFQNRFELVAPFGAHQAQQSFAAARAVVDNLVGENFRRTVPRDRVGDDRPVERHDARAADRQLQAFRRPARRAEPQ